MNKAVRHFTGNSPRATPAPARHFEPGVRRIVVVLHDFSGGGTEAVAVRLANSWTQQGREVTLFCGNEIGPLRSAVAPSVKVVSANPPIPRGLGSRHRLGRELARMVHRTAPDLVFGPGNFHIPVLHAVAVRKPAGTMVVCKISNPLVGPGRSALFTRVRVAALRMIVKSFDAFVAMSPSLLEEARQVLPRSRIIACWDPILNDPSASRRDLQRQPGLVIAIGRLEAQKNWSLALAAMEHLSRWSDARLVIMGEGPERGRLLAEINRLGLSGRVELVGYCPDVGTWLSQASCFLMTSSFEGYPAALVEALACGIPSVVTPCTPALADLRDAAGLLKTVAPDAGAIAAAVQTVLRQSWRPAARSLALWARHETAAASTDYLSSLDSLYVRIQRAEQTTSMRNLVRHGSNEEQVDPEMTAND